MEQKSGILKLSHESFAAVVTRSNAPKPETLPSVHQEVKLEAESTKKTKKKKKKLELSDVIITKTQQTKPKVTTPQLSAGAKPALNQSKLHSQVKWVLSLHFPSNDGPYAYATQLVNQNQDAHVLALLAQLCKSQKKLLSIAKQTQPNQTTQVVPVGKRKYCQGLNEVQKYVARNRVKLVVVTKNIPMDDVKIANKLNKMLDYAWLLDCPVVFSLTKKQMGDAIHLRNASTLGIFALDGISISELLSSVKDSEKQWAVEFVKKWNEDSIPRNTFAPHGETPIWIACRYNYRDPALLLAAVRAGWDVNTPDAYHGMTPLLIACKHHHYLLVANLLGINLWSLLKEKLDWSNRIPDLKELGRQDVDLTLKSFSGESCLHLAIGSPIILSMLMQRAEKEGILDSLLAARCLGKTAIQTAVEQLDVPSVLQLYNASTRGQLLKPPSLHHLASVVYSNKTKMLRLREMTRALIGKLGNAGLEPESEEGLTLLMLACKTGNPSVVVEILSFCSTPGSIQDQKPATKQRVPAPTKRITAEEVLSKATNDAKPKLSPPVAVTQSSKKPAKRKPNQPKIPSPYPTLSRTPASASHVNLVDKHKRTALWWACWRGDWDSVKMLMDVGADPTLADADGKTPPDVIGQYADSVKETVDASSDSDSAEEPRQPEEEALEADVEAQGGEEVQGGESESEPESSESEPEAQPIRPRIRRKDVQRIKTLFSNLNKSS